MKELLRPCEHMRAKTTMKIYRTYRELSSIKTIEERFEYLKIGGRVGEVTFGVDRYLNQIFYKSNVWIPLRDKIIARDLGCELGLRGYEISGSIIIHHINPIEIEDVLTRAPEILDPEYLICTSLNMHNAIHYGDKKVLSSITYTPRYKNDTCPWR